MSKERRYPKEWDDYLSVTEITELWSAQALLNYYRYKTPSEIKQNSDKALSIGKTFHEILDKRRKGEKVELLTDYPQEVKNCLKSYFAWENGRDLEIVASEIKMISPELGYKGTPDQLYKCNGKLILIDWKTSKAIYFDHKLQVVAYKKLFENINKVTVDECWILRVTKEKIEGAAPFEAFQIPNDKHDAYFKVFMNTLESIKIKKLEVVNA